MTRQAPAWQRNPPAFRLAASALVALAVMAGAGCTGGVADGPDQPVIVQPGAPGDPGRVLTDGPPQAAGAAHTEADVAFVHAMIAHHAQALELTALVAGRSSREDLALLARRIEVTQEDEIALLEDWLAIRGAAGGATGPGGHPGTGGHGGTGEDHDGALPGMLSERQLDALAASSGAAFDRLFLELMIVHHEGALTMIDELAAAGGGQEAALFRLVTDIGADQRIEIGRMTDLLAELPDPETGRA